MPGIVYNIDLDTKHFQKNLDGVQSGIARMGNVGSAFAPAKAGLSSLTTAAEGAGSGISGMGVAAAAIGATMAAAAAGAAALGVGFFAVKKGISAAAEIETLATSFAPLLGGMDNAKKRMADLQKFANDTPFDLPEVARASRTLETLTKGALSTSKGLKMVGDVAAATGQPFDEISVHMGRMYDGLKNGRPVGESMQRLQELGIISGETRGKIEKLQAEGKKGDAVWAVATQSFSRFGGSMERQSQTWGGMMSTFQDSVQTAFAAFGAPILDAVKPYLSSLITFIDSLKEKAVQIGEKIASGIRFIFAAFQSGNVTTLIGGALKLGFINGVNALWRGISGVFTAAGQLMVENFKTAMTLFQVLGTADFWMGLGNTLMGVFMSVCEFFQLAMAKTIDFLRPLFKAIGKESMIDNAQASMKQNADTLHNAAAEKYGSAKDQLTPAFDAAVRRLSETVKNVGEAFTSGYEKSGDALNSTTAKKEFAATMKTVQDLAAKNKAAQEKTAKDLDAKLKNGVATPTSATETSVKKTSGSSAASADRLAQMGLYMRGSAMSAREKIAERTEKLTAQSVKLLDKIANRSITPSGIFA